MIVESEAKKICKQFGITFKFDKNIKIATADIIKKEVIIHPEKSTYYDLMHEISHIICGWGCCREHCEWEAHGGAKILCHLQGFKIGDAEERMDCYAHRTNPEACGRFKYKDSWVEMIKTDALEELNEGKTK